jgi:hypothetical protein
MENLTAGERRTYQTSVWINGAAFAVAFVLLVGFVVLADAGLESGDVAAGTSPHSVAVVQDRK